MNQFGVGSKAPNFTLANYDDTQYTLSTMLEESPVVLIFYVFDELPNCDTMLCRINVDVDQFEKAGIKIVGINNSDTAHHANYAKKRMLKLPLLSDPDCRTAEKYNSVFSIGPIKVIRYSVVGIARNGRVCYYERGRPENAAIIAAMQEAASVTR